MRVKFRLSVLLRAQNRLVESGKIRAEVEHLLMNLRPPGSVNTDATDVVLLDAEASITHGRTAGIRSNGIL